MKLSVNIKKSLPGFHLDVNFKTGTEPLGLLGASGSGKSMALRCIAGLETPDSGRIVLNGRTLYDSEKGINLSSRHRKIGFLFQNYALFPHMSVEQNIRFGLGHLELGEQSRKVEKTLTMMHLEGMEKRYPHQLSGGQQQRVALARALAVEPEALFLDEPFSALDDYLRNQMVLQLIKIISEYQGVTLFVTHNMEEAYRLCENLVVLSEGAMEAFAHKDMLFKTPPTLAAARLTGCKNLSAARTLSKDLIEAVDWGCKIKLPENTTGPIKYVGIRAHYITLAEGKDEINTFNCWPSYINEAPFRVMVYLSIGRSPVRKQDFHIQWDMEKEQWEVLRHREPPWKIQLHPRNLILL